MRFLKMSFTLKKGGGQIQEQSYFFEQLNPEHPFLVGFYFYHISFFILYFFHLRIDLFSYFWIMFDVAVICLSQGYVNRTWLSSWNLPDFCWAKTMETTMASYNWTDVWPARNTTAEVEPNWDAPVNINVIMYIAIGLVGVLGNGMAIVIIAASRVMRTNLTNLFIVNQSAIDLLGSIFIMALSNIRYDSPSYPGIAGEIYCRLWISKTLMWSNFMSSTYNLVALTVERYLKIVHPIKHKVSFRTRQAGKVIIAVWLIGPLTNFPFDIPASPSVDGVCRTYALWPNSAVQKLAGIIFAVIKYFIPLFTMVFCYGRMFRVIRSKVGPAQQSSERLGHNANIAADYKMALASRNILKMLALVSVSFIVCWTPNQVLFLMFNLGYPVDFNGYFYHFTVYLIFINACINPIIYFLQYKKLQTELRRLLCRKARPEGLSDQSTAHSQVWAHSSAQVVEWPWRHQTSDNRCSFWVKLANGWIVRAESLPIAKPCAFEYRTAWVI